MPLVNDIFGGESMGRKKHGGPLVNPDFCSRSDGLHTDHGGFQAWMADGSPWVRSVFRAADDRDDFEQEPESIQRGREGSMRRVNGYIEDYKKAMIEKGREHEILPQDREKGTPFQLEERVPEEAVMELQAAFASRDHAAMAQCMIALDKYDPKHKSFDDRIAFWVKEFGEAWKPEFEKDDKVAKQFISDTLEPYMPPEFREIEKHRVAMEKYEEKKEKARAMRRQKQQESGEIATAFPSPVDLTDSSLSVIQAKSSNMEWETNALMGAHPGVMFGSHCAASLESLDLAALGGGAEDADPWAIDFALRYPKSKGRNGLAEEEMEMKNKHKMVKEHLDMLGVLKGKEGAFVDSQLDRSLDR